jgi:hypothetical protein
LLFILSIYGYTIILGGFMKQMTWNRKANKNGRGLTLGLSIEMLEASGLAGLDRFRVTLEDDGLMIRRPLPAPVHGVPPASAFKEEAAGDEGLF